jgi:hypothetical protein
VVLLADPAGDPEWPEVAQLACPSGEDGETGGNDRKVERRRTALLSTVESGGDVAHPVVAPRDG